MTKKKPRTFPEIVDWAHGWVLVEIGRGFYGSAIFEVVRAAWGRGYDEGRKSYDKPGKTG